MTEKEFYNRSPDFMVAHSSRIAALMPNISRCNSLPEEDDIRGDYAMADGLLDYFPNALAEVARVSKIAGDKHHPGERMHWERGKSTDHRNKIIRHLVDSGGFDSNGNRHSAALAWRALALLQEEMEAEGAPPPRNAVDSRRVKQVGSQVGSRDRPGVEL